MSETVTEENEDVVLGRLVRRIRETDQKLRRGDSIETPDLRVLRNHYKALQEATAILPQFYCAHQEALRRLQQADSYLSARKEK